MNIPSVVEQIPLERKRQIESRKKALKPLFLSGHFSKDDTDAAHMNWKCTRFITTEEQLEIERCTDFLECAPLKYVCMGAKKQWRKAMVSVGPEIAQTP